MFPVLTLFFRLPPNRRFDNRVFSKFGMSYQPPFHISADAINLVAEIAALVERNTFLRGNADALKLRRANRIKTIQATLAIEGGTLSEDRISEILDGKRVVAPVRQIQEVKNAIAVYDIADELDPYSMDDLLRAHGMMMAALMDRPGEFRQRAAGVVKKGQLIHVAPPARLLPRQMKDLFTWLRKTKDHPLIKSCVFHYEFEFIHPFLDGNGRIGRLWQSLILAKWNPVFLQLPVETMVYGNQDKYYQAINRSTEANDSGVFVDFMLREILNALRGHASGKGNADDPTDAVLRCIQDTPGIRTGELAERLSIGRRTAERHLQALKQAEKIEFRGAPRNGGYYPI